MVGNLASNALYRKYEEEKSLLELYGSVSSLTYEEWLEAKKQNNVKESINYWMSKCVSLQQEVDVLNEKLANASLIKWRTGEPKKTGGYLITTKTGVVCHDYWFCSIKKWERHLWDVLAWCPLSDIQPCIGEKVNNEKKP